ncbi:hypothetical protein HU200_057944 [Digitaria exilis]|uniref:Secreted protein n=1 Tax=Digitaria exilis TaxID=1010633 RepID=A0A835AJ86_9POAL|nr:hypothetical protein HU200_057944 [Digitaria exilis]
MASLSKPSCCNIAWFAMWRPVASSMMTCAQRRTLCRLSTSCTFSFELWLVKKFMDLDTSSPGSTERKVSIITDSLL